MKYAFASIVSGEINTTVSENSHTIIAKARDLLGSDLAQSVNGMLASKFIDDRTKAALAKILIDQYASIQMQLTQTTQVLANNDGTLRDNPPLAGLYVTSAIFWLGSDFSPIIYVLGTEEGVKLYEDMHYAPQV